MCACPRRDNWHRRMVAGRLSRFVRRRAQAGDQAREDSREPIMASAIDVLADLWGQVELPAEPLARVELTGRDPALPSSVRVSTAVPASIPAMPNAANTI